MQDQDLSHSGSEAEETADVLQRLEAYEGLKEQYGHYASLLEKAVTHRQSVSEHIFAKVKEEYEEKKTSLEKDRNELEALLRDNLETFLQEREKLGCASREQEDRLEEIDFRVLVGEYKEEGMAEERDALSRKLQQHTEELERTEEILKAYVRAGLSSSPAPSSDPPEGDPEGPDDASSSSEDEETLPSGETEMKAQDPEAEEACQASPPATEPAVETEQEAVGEFQVLGKGSELTDESCPVVQCLDAPRQSGFGEHVLAGGDACGAPAVNVSPGSVSGYLVAMEGSRRGERFPLLCSNITLGTSPGSDIRLSDPGIRNFHAQIHFKGRKHYLENLDDMGCSFVNGLQGGLMELKDGDIIRLGEIKFQVEYSNIN